VVFSFFKKDPKDARKPATVRGKPAAAALRTGGGTEVTTRPTAKPLGRPLSGPSTRFPDRPGANTAGPGSKPLPDQDRVRDHARLTTAKIDAIEAEMARDLAGGPRTTTTVAAPTTIAPTTGIAPSTIARTTITAPPTATTQIDDAGENSGLGGDIDAIEINTASGSSVIDEAAILFSNGQIDGAEAVLRAGLRRDDLGSSTRLAWLMLFELVNQRGDRPGYDQLAMDYALRFESPPPAWIDYSNPLIAPPAAQAHKPAATGGGACVRLPAAIDAGIVSHLEKLRGLTAEHAAVQLDVSDARSIDITGAGLLLRVLGAFKRSQRELMLVGASTLAEVLSRSVESGRRDPSDALWMLLLDVLRMLGRHDEFEEAAIQYCITFEVSPPSWEPPLANLKVAAPTQSPTAGTESVTAGAPFELRGNVDGEGEPHFTRLATAARNQAQVVIDCSQLRRLSFSAGSALLGTLRKIRQGGATIEMRQVSALVAVLLHLLGVTSIVTVHSRYS
jgi:anti-anti-sigma regulatory factor